MKTLVLMRHSHASSENSAWSDHERPLTGSGRLLASRTGMLLADYRIDRIICSSAVRTVETAELVATASGANATPEALDSLYLAGPATYPGVASEMAAHDDQVLLMIGHNPGIASLIMSWSAETFAMSPASVAIFELNINDWAEIGTREELAPALSAYFSSGIKQR
ncbi:MAG: histidine phosphatase family protein [Fuerstiella sp.]